MDSFEGEGVPRLDDTIKAMKISSLFLDLSDEIMNSFAKRATWISVLGGEQLFEQGKRTENIYLLLSGQLTMTIQNESGIVVRRDFMYRGEILGAVETVTLHPSLSTIRASRNSTLLQWPKDALKSFLVQNPKFFFRLAHDLFDSFYRTQISEKRRKLSTHVIAVIPVSENAPTLTLARKIASCLEDRSKVKIVDEELMRKNLRKTESDSELRRRETVVLNQMEQHFDTLLLMGSPSSPRWTRDCVFHSDTILFVADAIDREITLDWMRDLQRETEKLSHSRELALVHPSGCDKPQQVQRWLELIRPGRHHNVRLDDAKDCERLSRFLFGDAIGVALTGGAAKGFAHIGVLAALEEAKIPVDFIAGASMGAIVGSKFAQGWSTETIRSIMLADFKWRIADPIIPLRSLCGAKGMIEHLQRSTGDLIFEELWTPFVAVSCAMATGLPYVHDTGPVWRGVLASSSVPGIFPPVTMGNEVLCDGIFYNDSLTDVLEANCGRSIYVNVISTLDRMIARGVKGYARSLDVLQDIVKRQGKLGQVSIFDIVLRSLSIPGLRNIEKIKSKVDLYLEPEVDRFPFLDPRRLHEIIQEGYICAHENLEKTKLFDDILNRKAKISEDKSA